MLTPSQILIQLRSNPRPHLLFVGGNVALRLCYLYRARLPEVLDPDLPLGYRPGQEVEVFGLYSPSADEWLELPQQTITLMLHNLRLLRLEEEDESD